MLQTFISNFVIKYISPSLHYGNESLPSERLYHIVDGNDELMYLQMAMMRNLLYQKTPTRLSKFENR